MKSNLKELKELYGAEPEADFVFNPTFNAAPSQKMPIVREYEGRRILSQYRWGLVPFWAESVQTGYSMINARSETLAKKRSYSKPFNSQRCIVPASGFYEWQKTDKGKVPYFISRKSSPLMSIAGLFEQWSGPEDETVNSFTIITTSANKPVQKLHDRMPAILLPEELDIWLNPDHSDPDSLGELLRPWPDDDIDFYRVSKAVNNTRNNGKQLIEPEQDLFS